MPYSAPFLKLVFEGTLGTEEIFSFGLHYGGSGPIPTDVPTAIVDAITTFWTTGLIGSVATLKTVKLNHIGTNGRYTETTTVLHDFGTGGVVGTGTCPFPFQIALAISLQAAANRGRASKGRFYLPAPAVAVEGPNQVMTHASQTNVQLAIGDLLDALNVAVTGWSLVLVSNLGLGATATVERFRVGRALDTIRSRRNKIPEEYIGGVVTGP